MFKKLIQKTRLERRSTLKTLWFVIATFVLIVLVIGMAYGQTIPAPLAKSTPIDNDAMPEAVSIDKWYKIPTALHSCEMVFFK